MTKKERDTLYITHSGELLIWLIVILIFVGFFSIGYIVKEKTDKNDYRVFMQDVDGLIVGSPVRMMGIDVGYVKKIKPINNEVYVKFIITNPDVYIPQGTTVTVEFSGMAGSKSLELYPPNQLTYVDKDTPVMNVNPPKRLHDALWLLDNMYKKITSIIYTTSTFGAKFSEQIESHHKTGALHKREDLQNFINYSNKFLDDSNRKANEIKKNIEDMKKHGKQIQ